MRPAAVLPQASSWIDPQLQMEYEGKRREATQHALHNLYSTVNTIVNGPGLIPPPTVRPDHVSGAMDKLNGDTTTLHQLALTLSGTQAPSLLATSPPSPSQALHCLLITRALPNGPFR